MRDYLDTHWLNKRWKLDMWGVGSRFKSYERKIRIEYREKKKGEKKRSKYFYSKKKKMYKNCCYLLNV